MSTSPPQKKITLAALLATFDPKIIRAVKKLEFKGVEGKDVYNITAPFKRGDIWYVAGRVESPSSETDSQVMFFYAQGEEWILDTRAPVFDLQDPFVSVHHDEIIIGGVALLHEGTTIQYKTVFFKGKTLHTLKKFAQGPPGMKDIRLSLIPSHLAAELSHELEHELPSLGVFTRPQGTIGGRGRIGFMKIDSLDHFQQLSSSQYYEARLLEEIFEKEEWLGVNAVYILKNKLLGVLGHIAAFSTDGQKNYYPITFCFDPHTHTFTKMKIIARRQDLPQGKAKRPELQNVLFSGGLIRCPDGTAKLYTGAGDAQAYEITLLDPLLEYE